MNSKEWKRWRTGTRALVQARVVVPDAAWDTTGGPVDL
jgi:hypothetical protein